MNNDIEKIRNGWRECGRKISECQKHGIFHCKVLVSPTETYCQGCQYQLEIEAQQKEEQIKNEAWVKAQEKAQNWWNSLSLPQKQEQIKLLEESLKNEKPWEIDVITWGNIKTGQSETYQNGKFSTTDIEQVPTNLVEKFIDHSNIPPSSQTPNLNSFLPNNPSQPNNNQFSNSNQPNPATLNLQIFSTDQTISSTENLSFDNSRSFSETANNQKKIKNENISPTQEPENQSSLSVSDTSKSVIDTSQAGKDQGLIKKLSLASSLLLFLFLIGTIVFSLQKKNKKQKS